MIYKSRALDFAFRKPEFSTIYYTYSNESPSKYYISVLGGVGGPEFGKTCLYNEKSELALVTSYYLLHIVLERQSKNN